MMHSPASTGQTNSYLFPGCIAAMLAMAAFWLFQPQVSRADSNTLQQIADCSGIVDDTSRLHCYDRIAKESAANSKRATSTTALPADTGASAETPNTDAQLGEKYLAKGDSHESDQESTMQLVHAYKDRQRLWIFEFGNGQVWQQLEARYLSVPEDLPADVTVSQGVFGSYDLRIGQSGRTTKVKRLR